MTPLTAPQKTEIPPLDPIMVMTFVQAAHGDLEKTRGMLALEPRLIHAVWDWGAGDFETALGAAAHTGQREVALFLLERGARIDLFAAAMLGLTEVVRSAIEACPAVLHSTGPHGIPLLAHARAGGNHATAVVAFLQKYA